jgi:ArsR family transcriptional regulator
MEELLGTFKALSEETRLRIIKLLEHGELCVCDLTAALDLVQPKVSFHLAVLKEAGFIKDRKEGKWTHYRLDDSDLLRRLLILLVIERIPEEVVSGDTRRLGAFLHHKRVERKVVPVKSRKGCYGR